MKLYLSFCLALSLGAASAQATNPSTPTITPEQASTRLQALTRLLTTELRLQPHQIALLNRSAARELHQFNARRSGRPATAQPAGSAPAASRFEQELASILTPFQRATFEQLKAKTSLGEQLQSRVFTP
jgi:hypothetical protein